MKKILALLLASLMLLTSCGGVDPTETTDDPAVSGSDPTVSDTPVTTEPVERVDHKIPVLADTYVLNADTSGNSFEDQNYGTADTIHLKSSATRPQRYGYLKFDISGLVGDNDFTSINLNFTVLDRQNVPAIDAAITVYGCESEWTEDGVTFSQQPFPYGEVATLDTIPVSYPSSHSIPVTDYVRKCLAAGITEISFYLKESTVEEPMHIILASKEKGEGAPELDVSYTRERDNSVYNGRLSSMPELSENGIDTILGLYDADDNIVRVKPIEDTYVQGGETADKVLGRDALMEVKDGLGSTHRITYLKFDLQELANKNTSDVYLRLFASDCQDNTPNVPIKVYGCDPYSWSEDALTYNNNTVEKEEYVTTGYASGVGVVFFDVTDYVKKAMSEGIKTIAFVLENDGVAMDARRFMFDTKDGSGTAPFLEINLGDLNFSTLIKYEGVNPWQVAMDSVTTWFDRWKEIKKGGDSSAKKLVRDTSEFSVVVDVSNSSKGADTKYSPYNTRLLSTLKDYKYNAKEVNLYDEYGGFMGGEKYEATGFFYTTKIGDRWWTIDPLGYPFYRTACVQVSPGASPNQKSNILAEFGAVENWASWATELLTDYGFNSTGGWSDIATLSTIDNPLAQTQILGILTQYTREIGVNVTTGGSVDLIGCILPVFDPAFPISADKRVAELTAPYVDASYIYGWMSDNELPDEATMLDNSLVAERNDKRFMYSYATAWTFMYLKTGDPYVSIYDVTDELRKEYRAMVYDKYFEVVRSVLDKYVPNHQYMGCRFLPGCYRDEYVQRVAGYWCDVISINYYGAWTPDTNLIYNIQKWAGRPFIVTEWYAKGMDVWEKDPRITNVTGAGFTVRTQADRGKFYQNYALGLMECKGCVGFDWFKYWDNDPDDLTADLSNRDSNKGIFSTAHEEYTVLTEYMEELNNNKYSVIKFFDER